VLGPGWVPVGMPMLIAELVPPDPPPVEPTTPRPIARDRRPLTPPRPIAAPVPVVPPARPEPEPPQPVVPAPPPVATPEPDPKPTSPEPVLAQAPTASPAPAAVNGPPQVAPADPGPGAFAASAPARTSSTPGARSSSEREATVAAIPSDGITQRAIPRGGYQYFPPYPSAARRLGVQGTTVLHVLVANTGLVAQVVVKQSAGHPDLDQAATDAVRRWRFEPARRGTEPVEMWVQLPFEFRFR
jgi:periplasmic protein TonB